MNYTFYEPQEEKEGVVSNLHGFVHRYLDGGFKSKWSGYWVPPYKYLDYFSFRVNGIWLDQGSIECVEYGEKMIFHHETESLEIEEQISVPQGIPGARIKLKMRNRTEEKKAVHALMEAGVDIRHKSQDVGSGEYSIDRTEDRLVITRSGKKLAVESDDLTDFKGESYSKEHYPGERQVCLVPPRGVFRTEIEGGETEILEIEFKTSEGAFGDIEQVEQSLDHELGRTFSSSIQSLKNLTYNRKGLGIIAGHPWFQNYWARDSFWSLMGLIDAGYFRTSEQVLENFAEKGIPGKIRTGEQSEGPITREDTWPLYIIASEKLRKHSGGLSTDIENAREDAMKKLEIENKIVQHDPRGTWMDTLDRAKAIDIQSLWLEAARIMDDRKASKLREGLKKFREDELLKDSLEHEHHAINPTIPLMFGQIDQKKALRQLEKINGEFSSRYGARTRSVTDPGYDASGYHTGSVWGLTTCWAAAANLQYGKDREGCNFLEKLSGFLDRDQPGALPEVVDAESGELIGAPEQAWSAGMFLHVVDSYLLGIEVLEDHVRIDPAGELSCSREGKRIRGEKIDLEVNQGEVEILNDPDLDLRL